MGMMMKYLIVRMEDIVGMESGGNIYVGREIYAQNEME